MKEPDFGTYHYSTPAASKKIRAVVKVMFADAFASLPLEDHDYRFLVNESATLVSGIARSSSGNRSW